MIATAGFKKKIWDHYRREGRKLAWRETRDPYRILVSEVMLQQTQVARVAVKYPEFIKSFANFEELSEAPVSKVLAAWQGMGYNRRALSLKKLAETVVNKHNGKLPSTIEALMALPGIGKATAGSLSAFVFNKPVPFIETNIRRVYLHFFFPMRDSVSDAELMPIIETTVDKKNAREWYYALMDYGSILGRMQKLTNPNRRSKAYKVQSKFTGSTRELRGKILKLLVAKKQAPVQALPKLTADSVPRVNTALAGLQKEGFVTIRRGRVELAA